jgi:hypothetical protein
MLNISMGISKIKYILFNITLIPLLYLIKIRYINYDNDNNNINNISIYSLYSNFKLPHKVHLFSIGSCSNQGPHKVYTFLN